MPAYLKTIEKLQSRLTITARDVTVLTQPGVTEPESHPHWMLNPQLPRKKISPSDIIAIYFGLNGDHGRKQNERSGNETSGRSQRSVKGMEVKKREPKEETKKEEPPPAVEEEDKPNPRKSQEPQEQQTDQRIPPGFEPNPDWRRPNQDWEHKGPRPNSE